MKLPKRSPRLRARVRAPGAALAGLVAIAVVAGLAGTVAGCGAEPPAAPELQTPRNVVLVLVDTLRADHLGAYGYGRDTSPAVDAFAREGVRFTAARSQAGCTFPSANSILTSRSPAAFLGQANDALGIPASIPTLAEILQERGFRTVAVSASPVVRRNPSHHNPHGGFGAGFEIFDEDCLDRSAWCVNRQALGHLEGDDGRPLFLYLHYMDPHAPYHPPSGWERKFALERPERPFIRNGNANPLGAWLYDGAPDPRVTPEELQHLVDLYDDEIAFFDRRFGELLGQLRSRGLLEDSLVVLLSDHGEEFLEHGHVKHCRTVFDNSVRTPLIVRAPGLSPREVSHPVQNLDVVPTVLDLLGVEPPPGAPLEGRSLRASLESGAPAGEHQFALQARYRGAADGRFKLIQDLSAGSFALYDLAGDPGERHDVLRRERRAFHRLREALTAHLARTEPGGAAEGLRKSTEAERKLRALGYLD